MTTYDLMSPLYTGADPRAQRGRLILPTNQVSNGWLSYGDGTLIQWDDRRSEGFEQDARVPHYAVSIPGANTPREARYARIVTTRVFHAPFTFSGWASIRREPAGGNDGFKITFLHESNEANWLVQLLRGNRVANLFQEDRVGMDLVGENAPYGKQWDAKQFNWQVGRTYRFAIDVDEFGKIRVFVDDKRNPLLKYRRGKVGKTGQVGFRLDRTIAHMGGLVVREY